MPPINKRIKELINQDAHGSVKRFSEMIGLSSSQKLNRIFNIDSRNGRYPEPSYDIVAAVANKYPERAKWMLTGNDDVDLKALVPEKERIAEDPGEDYGSNLTIIKHWYNLYIERDAKYMWLTERYERLMDKYDRLTEILNQKFSGKTTG